MRHGGPDAGVIERANAVRLTPALLKEVMRALDALPSCQRGDFTARGQAMLRLLDDELPEIVAPRDHAAVLLALDLRMSALARLCERPEWRAWLGESSRLTPSSHLHDAMIEAAATEPLIERDGRAVFDPGRFFRTMLRRCEAEGQA